VRAEPVLLVHGLGSSFDHGWREPGWVDLLSDAGRAVIAVDLLGHGNADKPHDPAAYGALEQGVAAVLPDEPVDAVGFSLGGITLLRLAAQAPARFARLVINGVGANALRDDDPEPLASAFESGAEPAEVTSQLFVRFAEGAGNDRAALAACLRRPRRALTPEELGAVNVPVLAIIGDRDFAGPADDVVAALPDARLKVLPGVDHFRAIRDFGCIDAALEFLDAVP
jgi:pimeloyl-ACP methyl ester carboxylesterase